MRSILLIPILILSLSCTRHEKEQSITTATLLKEMVDLNRLTLLPEQSYKTIQYSSYDRRSTKPGNKDWFSNEDGFGNEPIPGFEKVLREPDTMGIGEYLICDIRKPGAILRLWTAGIDGNIRLFLDDMNTPVYDGNARDFFWKTIEVLSGEEVPADFLHTFRQFDASYFPIPFSKGCRIEWIGDISKIHFYHVGIRIYDSPVNIETFKISDFQKYQLSLEEIHNVLKDPDSDNLKNLSLQQSGSVVPANSTKELFTLKGEQAIRYFSLKINANETENVLRKIILSIYFDDSSIPQVQAPVGDFFGSAPGINPYTSLPFSVKTDSTMVCRFVMPFKHSARIEVENNSPENITLVAAIGIADNKWEDGLSMHFRTRWRISHGLTASGFDGKRISVPDILYLMASGTGRVVGASAFLYNPSNAITSWGNWWGEGDEKIFADRDTFPSFFGTGSEDYFNYSWSSSKIFSYPYCGQPRNDGPGNRGYVSNFRWHISDDIFFTDKIAFYMELGHHGLVPGFSYGRMVCFYALPGLIDDYQKISESDTRDISYRPWKPEAYCGSAGYRFIQAEKLIAESSNVKTKKGKLWSEENILMWSPSNEGEQIKFHINSKEETVNTNIGLTLAHCPDGGLFSVFLNGLQVQFDGKDTLNLFHPNQEVLENSFSQKITLKKGINEIAFKSCDINENKKVGIDFIWIK